MAIELVRLSLDEALRHHWLSWKALECQGRSGPMSDPAWWQARLACTSQDLPLNLWVAVHDRQWLFAVVAAQPNSRRVRLDLSARSLAWVGGQPTAWFQALMRSWIAELAPTLTLEVVIDQTDGGLRGRWSTVAEIVRGRRFPHRSEQRGWEITKLSPQTEGESQTSDLTPAASRLPEVMREHFANQDQIWFLDSTGGDFLAGVSRTGHLGVGRDLWGWRPLVEYAQQYEGFYWTRLSGGRSVGWLHCQSHRRLGESSLIRLAGAYRPWCVIGPRSMQLTLEELSSSWAREGDAHSCCILPMLPWGRKPSGWNPLEAGVPGIGADVAQRSSVQNRQQEGQASELSLRPWMAEVSVCAASLPRRLWQRCLTGYQEWWSHKDSTGSQEVEVGEGSLLLTEAETR